MTTYTLEVSPAGAYTFTPSSPPPPSTKTRALFVQNLPSDGGATLLGLLPTLKAASYNQVKFPAEWTSCVQWCAANGMGAALTLGGYTNGAWYYTPAQQEALAVSVAKILPGAEFFLIDEPAIGNTALATQVLQRAAGVRSAVQAAVPGAKGACLISYFDAGSVATWNGKQLQLEPLDKLWLDEYPNQTVNDWDWSLITELADAAGAAGLAYTYVAGLFAATGYTMPTAAQAATNLETILDTDSDGFCVYAWNIGAEQAAMVQVVKATATP